MCKNNPTNKELMLKEWEGRCVYCEEIVRPKDKIFPGDRMLTIDHFIPIKRKGLSSRFNYVPSCHTCNVLKGAQHPIQFLIMFYGGDEERARQKIDDIMNYFNYIYYLCKSNRWLILDEVNRDYKDLWQKMNQYTTMSRLDVPAKRKKKRRKKRRKIQTQQMYNERQAKRMANWIKGETNENLYSNC
jgi:hypothetical protein